MRQQSGITETKRPGRPATGRKTPAEYQEARRKRLERFGIKELRGIRISETEENMLDQLVAALGYGDRAELIMMEMRKLADQNGIDYRLKTGG